MTGRGGAADPPPGALAGFRVGVAGSWRREEQVGALHRRGATVVGGPVVGAVPLIELEVLEAATDDVLGDPPDLFLVAPGSGFEVWLGAAELTGRGQALREVLEGARVSHARDARVVSEGTARVDRVAVQLDGGPDGGKALARHLRRTGLDVVEIPVLPVGPPPDAGQALALVEAVAQRRVDAVTFTTATEVRRLAALAAGADRGPDVSSALAGEVLPVCFGRSCVEAAADLGMAGVAQPERPRLGDMVECLAQRLGDAALRLVVGGVEVVVQGALAVVAGQERPLTERERAVLVELARRPGAVVAKGELLRRVWRMEGARAIDVHAVEVVVGRLRRRLGPAGAGLQTVPRRGYRLVAEAAAT